MSSYDDNEAWWVATGNKSRVTRDTDIKLGDRLILNGPSTGNRTIVGNVVDIIYRGTFRGYVSPQGREPFPTFAPYTTIIIDRGDGVSYLCHPQDAVRL
jgi:hypothetical protein